MIGPTEGDSINATPGNPPEKGKHLTVEEALIYLDQVKVEFSDKPHIYNEFLEIMKKFKAQDINTPGVIIRVKELFKGYNKLILGFNQFLPDGEDYKIELTPEEKANDRSTLGNVNASGVAPTPPVSAVQQQPGAPGAPVQQQPGAAGTAPGAAVQQPAGGAAPSKSPKNMQQQHAITYVTNIRNRFNHEPDIYRSFLKILHTYQREQKGIKDVLEQVSTLFADHPDLLMEFTYFLPDAVQEQAKERLQRAAREADVRRQQALLRAQQQAMRDHHLGMNAQKRGRMDPIAARGGHAGKRAPYVTQAQAAQRKNAGRRGRQVPDGSSLAHSISVERKFFDHIRDLLLSTGRDNWSEFLKILDLFTQDAISKKDMLDFVKELFGPMSNELFEDFKALMNSKATYDANGQDMFFGIASSEIDFSQSRKCTPSYRALPKEYPRAMCTERGDLEKEVLNDDWVSIPIGSEESNSFKHMRKNQYEEALFKCEDERFEIDACIDSNLCTLKILEPMADEISAMRTLEERDHPTPKFTFQLEKRNFSTIHLNAISRIYGEHGSEILELLRKNPAGTIPVLVKRLRQKDLEWRKARQELNRQWRDVLEKNYDKSFDHRSFYFRTADKRFYNARHLINDIKPSEGTSNSASSNQGVEDIKDSGITTTVPKELSSLCKVSDMQPQLVLNYDNSHKGIHKDLYKIVCVAVESTITNPRDKEKIAALWRDLLRTFFNLPVQFLYEPGSVTSESVAKEAEAGATLHKGESWTPNARVLTIFGSGIVKEYRESDSMYRVTLAFGEAFLNSASILGGEELSPQSLEALGLSNDGKKINVNESQLDVSSFMSTKRVETPCEIFYGTQMCYCFMRLHHTLFHRLTEARRLAEETAEKLRGTGDDAEHPMKRFDESDPETEHIKGVIKKIPVYNTFLSQLIALIDGSTDNTKYEDFTRQLLGNKGYIVITLDKVIQQLVKCLTSMANDVNVTQLVGLYMYHRTRVVPPKPLSSKRLSLNAGTSHIPGVDPKLYHAHVGAILSNTMEDVYRMENVTKGKNEIDGTSVVAIQVVAKSLPGLFVDQGPVPATSVPLTPKATLPDDDGDAEDNAAPVSAADPSVEERKVDTAMEVA